MLDVASFHVYVQGVSARAGISVQWDEPGSTPRTDGKTVYLPRPGAEATEESLIRLRYFLKHEVSHIKYTAFAWWKEKNLSRTMHMLCNLLEDHRIDYCNDMQFPGDRRLSAAFWTLYAGDIAASGRIDNPLTPAFAWDFALRDWIPTATLARRSMTLSPEEEAKLALLTPLAGRLLAIRSEPEDNDALLALAKDVYRILFDKAAEEEKGTGEGEGGEEGEPFPGMSDDLTPSEEECEKEGEKREGKKKPGRGRHSDDGAFTPMPLGTWPKPDRREVGYSFDPARIAAELQTTTAPIINKLRHLLQVRSLSHYEYGQKKGKIVQGALASLALTQNDRVFKRKVESDTLDTAVSILLDMSGSMDAVGKMQNAALAVAALAKALAVVRVPFKAEGFLNAFHDTLPRAIPLSDWGQNATPEHILNEASAYYLQDNADGEFILRAAYDLMQRPEKRKILLVVSDGEPACAGRTDGLEEYTKGLISYLEEKTPIEVCALGIGYDVGRFYKHSQRVNNSAMIPSALVSLFTSCFK